MTSICIFCLCVLKLRFMLYSLQCQKWCLKGCDIQNTSMEIRFNFSASRSAELIFQLFKYYFFICVFVMDRILSAHGMAYLNQLLWRKIQKQLSVWQWKICLAFLYLWIGWCLKISFSSFYSKIYLQQNCVLDCYDGEDVSTPAFYFLIPWIQNLA
jgi:hypothetical protein